MKTPHVQRTPFLETPHIWRWALATFSPRFAYLEVLHHVQRGAYASGPTLIYLKPKSKIYGEYLAKDLNLKMDNTWTWIKLMAFD